MAQSELQQTHVAAQHPCCKTPPTPPLWRWAGSTGAGSRGQACSRSRVPEGVYLKGASQWAIMAATASLTTRLPASLLLLPLSLTMARRAGRLPVPRASRHCFSPMSHTYRLSMATPAVMACRFTCAASPALRTGSGACLQGVVLNTCRDRTSSRSCAE